jgi:hypothetical protein
MIDLAGETVLTLMEATRQLPGRRQGKKPHVATLYRWAKKGLRGVRLETLQLGGTLCTSREALQRFFDRLTEADERGRASVQCQSTFDQADAELDRLGL